MKMLFTRSVKLLIFTSISANILMLYMLHTYTTGNARKHQGRAENDAVNVFAGLNGNQDAKIASFNFSINPKDKCSWDNEDMITQKFVVVVVSKIDNFFTRYAIRRTWGSFDKKLGTLLFLVGLPEDSDAQNQLHKEATLYNDVIQVNITDAYNLLTYKSIAMLEWLYRFCSNADFYMKADDDAYINVNMIANATGEIQEKRYFLCKVFENGRPRRNKTDKWFVPFEQFDGEFYPTYCSGTAYLFPSSILMDLYKSALTSKFITMEDIYVTGISAQNLNVSYINSDKFLYHWSSEKDKINDKIMEFLSIHRVKTYDILNIHSVFMRNNH